MRIALAEQLLAKIMEWTPDEVTLERPLLQALADFKYDEYQQFSPGIRFIESLAQWLNQFEKKQEKDAAYEFVKNQIIFVSNNQMSHLVNLSFTTLIRPILIEKAAERLSCEKYLIKKIISSQAFKDILRQSLFIGLSDGAHIDQLRRYAHLDNEQVLTTYYIDKDKVADLQQELNKDSDQGRQFTSIFLIDDFTASGTSYARIESEEQMKGKILKLLHKIFFDKGDYTFSSLIDKNSFSIHIIFYLATDKALNRIKEVIDTYLNRNNIKLKYSIDSVQILGMKVKDNVLIDKAFMKVIEREEYFDKSIVDKHYLKGLISNKPYLGFGECALPLVLYHNAPNNSIPLLWFSGENGIKGLFPRITRHKE